MYGFKLRPLLAAALILAPAGALAEASDQRTLSSTVHIGLRIVGSATVGRSTPNAPFFARDYSGNAFSASDVNYILTDKRGERVLSDLREVDRALVQAQRAGERDIELTIFF